MFKKILLATISLMLIHQVRAQLTTNRKVLARVAAEHRKNEEKNFQSTLALARAKGWPQNFTTREGWAVKLVGVDPFGLPVYLSTENLIAAGTTGANKLWEGGATGLNLSGASDFLKGKMAVWDEGRVLASHVELEGRVLQKDNPSSISDHATHVSGTLIGAGINPAARGMAYGMKQLLAYDFDAYHFSEIMSEAPNLLLSNHSYGTLSGWYYNSSQSRWEFRGRYTDNEDYKFGYYNSDAQLLDSIAYNAPYYLMVKSAGNNRSQNGPAVGQTYWRYNASGQMTESGPRPSGISSNDGYDIIATYGTAKNILTVGAVRGIGNGYYKTSDVVMSSFSSWGPTDDGRIKPDVVADGVGVLSSVAGGSGYASFNGTSMATPNATGSLLLLQEHFARLNGARFMRAATLKGLAIHTTDEAGDAPGPDYKFGWGLLNVARAAEVIGNSQGHHRLLENVLAQGETFSLTVVASGRGPLQATLSWTDPKGSVEMANILNNPSLKLVNDLDLRISTDSLVFKPWRLNPALPEYPAEKEDNFRDNVERIDIENPIPGKRYVISISHKNILDRGSQAYSLILSGVGGQPYCSSGSASVNGSRIDSVAFAGIQKPNATACRPYTNNTQVTATAEPNQSLPVFVKLNSCDGNAKSRYVKVFIDYNSNGSFDDEGELAAGGADIAGIFSSTVKIPSKVAVGNRTILRIVAADTADANAVTACGTYSGGETQDFVLSFTGASHDLSVLSLANATAINCANPTQTIAVNIRNNGTAAKSNLPVLVEVKKGDSVVAAKTSILPATIGAYEVFNYSVPLSFHATAGSSYVIKTIISDPQDQIPTNDTLISNFTVAALPAAPDGRAVVCGSTANLIVSNPVGSNSYLWYTAGDEQARAIGRGNFFNTTIIPQNHTYYLGSGVSAALGLKSKDLHANGGGYLSNTGNYIKYSSNMPLVLESARLYSKFGGKVDISVIELTSETATGYNYRTLATTTIDVYPTSPNPQSGSVPGYDVADSGAVFRINLPLPAGFYAIRVATQGGANLFRNNNVTGKPYPFDIPGVISFYSNSAAPVNQDPDYFQSFYYFLYDMKLRTTECPSPKTAILATVSPPPAISLVNDTLVSSAATGNQWNLNGVPIAGATAQKHKPTEFGAYSVTVLDSLSCQQTSAVINFTITAVNPVDNAGISLKLAPNPTRGPVRLSLNLTQRSNLMVEVFNSLGQRVYIKAFTKQQGQFVEELHLSNLPAGVYLFRLKLNENYFYEKIVVQR